MIRKQGYAAEEHLIATEDGYLITLHRIPGPTSSPVVLLEHGLLASSFDFTANRKDEALGILLDQIKLRNKYKYKKLIFLIYSNFN